MLVKVRITTVLLLMALPIAFLPGCGSNSSNGGSAGGGQSLHLSLATTNGGTTLIADGNSSSQIQMTVTNQDGQPIGNRPVKFSTNAGALFPVPGTNVISTNAAPRAETRQTGGSSSITVSTNTQGIALVQLTSSTHVETATVTAEVEGFRQAFNINFISGIPSQLTVSASPSIVGVGQTAAVEARVVDSTDRPVVGVSVTFSLSVSNSGASISPATRVTDTNGQARVTYTAGAITGEDTIQAQLGTVTSATATTASITATKSVSVSADSVAATDIKLLVSSPQINSDGSETVTLTALVRDFNNNLLSDVDVTFGTTPGSSAAIQVTRGTTDTTGTAEALLTTGGDFSNRVIELVATAGSLTGRNDVEVSGTTIAISGVNSLVLGGSTTLSILLQDSGGNGIANRVVAITSNQGNTLSASTATTDANGQSTVQVTADSLINDTITASALGASGTTILVVNSADFSFIMPNPTAPADQREIALGTSQTVTIRWLDAGIPQVGETINFFATRGTLTATSAVTDASGEASVEISSTTAGPSVITAEANMDDGPSSQVAVEFVATNPTSLILQATPTTLGVNPVGTTNQQSTITAVVRDAANNLVKNQRVSFTLTDSTGGSIFPAAATTDSFGRASTVYTAGATPSAQNGVIINAVVAGTISDEIRLTVAQQALFIKLGTGNLIQPVSDTQYAKPYSVLVTDANSNPVAGARVELNVDPTRYQKGSYVPIIDENDACTGWGKRPTVVCLNEDQNSNGILDLNLNEDFNSNGILDPGNIATVPTTVTTDATGFAFFDVAYAREFTWVEVQLKARATVAGSEASSTATFFLPGVVSDFDDCDISPPGQESPYGQAITCSCDETVDPECPTLRVTITPASDTVPAAGGTVLFEVEGGTGAIYAVALEPMSGACTLHPSIVIPEAPFTLNCGPNTTGSVAVFTVTATDQTTGQSDFAIVTQQPLDPVTITPTSVTVPAEGDRVLFEAAGGTSSYTVEATAGGTVEDIEGNPETEVSSGTPFVLNVLPNMTGSTVFITVTVTDQTTGQTDTAIVTQPSLP